MKSVVIEGVDADQREAVVEHREHGHADERAEHRARAAHQSRAADHCARHAVGHQSCPALQRLGRPMCCAVRSRRSRPVAAQHEVADAHPVHVDAALAGADAVAADRDRVQPQGVIVSTKCIIEHEAEGPVERVEPPTPNQEPKCGTVGVSCWEPSEIRSEMPLRMLNIPSVTIRLGTRRYTVTRPFVSPTSAATPSPTTTPAISGQPCSATL